jgi:pimeloyl-ACP methyl ester carboxylesterase
MTGESSGRGRYVEVGGARLYVESAGEGPAVVFLHAGICDRRMWDAQVEPFASAYRVVRYDRRGFGRTVTVAEPFSHHADLARLLDALDVERAALVGCSQGGLISIDFALEHPERVSALVLVASALGGFPFSGEDTAPWGELEAAIERGDLDRANEIELRIWVDGEGRAPDQVDPAVRELVRDMNRIALAAPDPGEAARLDPPAYERLGEIACPALVVVGDLDTPRARATADHLAATLRDAKKVVLEGTAHLPSMERPDDFNRLALAWLSGM